LFKVIDVHNPKKVVSSVCFSW